MTDPDPLHCSGRRWSRPIGILIALATGCLLAVVIWFLWREYNPFINQLPSVREATILRDTARTRSLTDAEFDRLVVVAGSGEPVAVLSAIAGLELEAGRGPDRREKVVATLTNLQQSRDAEVKQSATSALARTSTTK